VSNPYHEHTLSPACWCAPVVLHIGPDGTASVDNVRDADRLAQLGVTDVVVRPAVPPQGR